MSPYVCMISFVVESYSLRRNVMYFVLANGSYTFVFKFPQFEMTWERGFNTPNKPVAYIGKHQNRRAQTGTQAARFPANTRAIKYLICSYIAMNNGSLLETAKNVSQNYAFIRRPCWISDSSLL